MGWYDEGLEVVKRPPKDLSLNSTTLNAAHAALGWSQRDLAREAGLCYKLVAYWKAGPGEMPQAANGALRCMREALARYGLAIEGDVLQLHVLGR